MKSAWFCILTNVSCISPAYVTYKKKLLGETVFTLSTGISSVLYHGMELYDWGINRVAIRNTDVILSFLLVCHTAHCITISSRRWDATISVLPLVIFGCEMDILYRLIGVTCYVLACLVYICITKQSHNRAMVTIGAGCAIGDIAFFLLGNQDNYAILHGMHHIFIFTAQACVLHGAPLHGARIDEGTTHHRPTTVDCSDIP